MSNTQRIDPLPETGSLGPRKVPTVQNTLEDVIENNFLQNKSINYLVQNMEEVKTSVKNHAEVVSELVAIKVVVKKAFQALLWVLGFLGLGGLGQLLGWFPHA